MQLSKEIGENAENSQNLCWSLPDCYEGESDTNHVPAVIPGFTSFGSDENCEIPTTIVEFRNIDFDSSDNCSEESDSGDNRNSVNPRYLFDTYLAECHLKEKTRSWDDVSEFSNENVETAVCRMTLNDIYFRNNGLLQTFLNCCFHSQIMKGLRSMDCHILTDAQCCIMSAICAGRNAVFHFPRGSGRLVGFLAPILNWILKQKNEKGQRPTPCEMNPQAVIVAPSINFVSAIFNRCLDLAICTDLVIRCAMSSACWKLVGSHPELGCDVLIGTPEGLQKFRNQNCSMFDNCRFLVVMHAPDIFFSFENQMTRLLCDFPKDNTNVFCFSARYTDHLYTFYREKIDSDLIFLPNQPN
ncbi:ATP-dependent RNA helicase has1 [Trichinella britovi]|uniref:ATP-dependent RNA helicase has1 n=1 Tax=Trichinella britovi TaxID=45882 RepID=A0A0V1CNW4_TRIBR|nr:ATP-dependent RNA helicase has1 [Trichinella britovi]